jgi:hypothetical protein
MSDTGMQRSAESVRRPRTYYACIGDDLFLCPHCGAVVLDTELHQTWHGLTGTLIDGSRAL